MTPHYWPIMQRKKLRSEIGSFWSKGTQLWQASSLRFSDPWCVLLTTSLYLLLQASYSPSPVSSITFRCFASPLSPQPWPCSKAPSHSSVLPGLVPMPGSSPFPSQLPYPERLRGVFLKHKTAPALLVLQTCPGFQCSPKKI